MNMTTIDNSWMFLFDFYHSDRSIVSLINKAIGFKCDKVLRDDSYEAFMEDLLSLLPTQGKSYQDFLSYVKPIEVLEEEGAGLKDDETTSIKNHENICLNFNWFDNFKGSSRINYQYGLLIGRRTKIRSFFKAIMIGFATLKKVERFIDNVNKQHHEHKPHIILHALGLSENWFQYHHIAKDYVDDDIKMYFRLLRRQKSIKSRTKLMPADLYPVMTLLIVLRREWNDSRNGVYIENKLNSYKLDSPESKQGIINDILIYGLYRKYEFADRAIIQNFNPYVPRVDFHPLVAKQIIQNESYKDLFKSEYNEKISPKNECYEAVEKKLDKENFNEKRLLLDYIFPYTVVREHDVFRPKTDAKFKDRIYLSLKKGADYQQYWRMPEDGEKFKYIQIDPQNENDNDGLISYQVFLAPGADFLIIKSEKDYELEDHIKNAFSDFRHNLKTIMSKLSDCVTLLQSGWNTCDTLKLKERIDRIKELNDWLNSYINMAGYPKMRKKHKIQIVDFLREFSHYEALARNTGRINYIIDDSAIQRDCTIYFDKDSLRIILDAIVENADIHGFRNNSDCKDPTIAFELVSTEHYLLLKICNNGRPISISSDEYKTRGAIAGPTGNTGLGGYLINKYVTEQGGKIELPIDKKWNTEIHLYLKK